MNAGFIDTGSLAFDGEKERLPKVLWAWKNYFANIMFEIGHVHSLA
jgi:hypothetical protein